jgi:DNA-binding NtrC family response regulator
MTASDTLSPADREFFELVSQAAFSNPFSDTRQEFDMKIAGGERSLPKEKLILQVVHRVSERVRKLEDVGAADIRRYRAEERFVVQNAFLFDVFHQFISKFDHLILDQVAAGDTPQPVPFARDALAMLARRGFSNDEALRFFAIFYQLRRAFFFIAHGLIGQSPCMVQLRLRLWNNVFTHDIRWYDRYLWNRMEDFSTLLLGETGTGKGTAAAAIGRSGFIPFDAKKGCFAESFTRSFIALNLSQFSEALIESELFGHRKGAFTGAIQDHEGIFARCSAHGAIFLDEIGEIAVPIQIKLLQILQERTFSPVGSHEKLRFKGRVIAATNKPLAVLRSEGKFRDDFYYRLCSDIITVPPLRQRVQEEPDELATLIASIVQRTTGQDSQEVVAMAHENLDRCVAANYPWPGNVRELEQAIRRILLTQGYEGAQADAPDLRAKLVAGIEAGTLDADALLSAYCALLYERHGTFEEVARRTNLDRRTVKAYIDKPRAPLRKNEA